MIWGDTDLLRRITVTVGDDPAIDQLLVLYDHPQGLAPEAAAELGGGSRRDHRRRRRDGGRHPGRLHPPRPDRRSRRAASWRAAACPRSPGCERRWPARGRSALRAPSPGRLREIASAAARTTGAGTGLAPTAGWTRSTPRSYSGPRDRGARGQGRRRARMSARRAIDGAGWAGGDEAGDARAFATRREAGALRLDLRTARSRRGPPTGSSRARRRSTAARVLVERMVPPGVELLVAARSDAVVPALVVGLGGIWTEALDDVAIVPLPASAERVARGDRLAARSRRPQRRARPRPGRPRERRASSPPRWARCSSSTSSTCSS